MKKILKQGIALAIAVTLTATSGIPIFAKNVDVPVNGNLLTQPFWQPDLFSDIISGKATEEAPVAPVINNFEDVKALAQKKADTLSTAYGSTSVQYALMEDGKITLSGHSGVYSTESAKPPTNQTMYGIGSVSKVFTTAAVMKLVEEGKIDLDSRVITYLPDFFMADKRYIDITVRMLLNHSSGLLGTTQNNALLFNDSDPQARTQLLKNLQVQRLKADPGAFSVYCNDGFTLAELVIEKVTGMTFSNYIEQNFSTPLAMTNTKTPDDTFNRDLLAKTYYPGSSTALPCDVMSLIGAGGIYSTAENLCTFSSMFMKDYASILSQESVAAMQNPEYQRGFWSPDTDNTFNYGLGWDSVDTFPFPDYGIKALAKAGDTQLYHTTLILLPEENMSVSVLTSGGASTYNQVAGQEILLAALKAKGRISEIKPYKTVTPPIQESMPSTLKEHSGIYGFFGGTLQVSVNENGTVTLAPDAEGRSAQSQIFTYGGNNRFYAADSSTYLSFEKAANETTYLYVFGYAALPGLGQTVTSSYQGQKLEANPLSDEVAAAWKKRENNIYFIQNEKYSSQIYGVSSPYIQILPESKSLPGYMSHLKITDANNAKALLQIPIMYSRDLKDLKFFTSGKKEKLMYGDYVCINEKDIPTFSTKKTFTVAIPKNGYALYYKIPAAAVGKTVTVSAPKNSTFAVYNSSAVCVNNSYISGIKKAVLPKDGYVLLAGDAGTKLKVTYQ